ncbi:MAG: hypothetical protein HOE45_01855, partial [Gammaproteobacteria bacterium]|nr:hypothetical protein [Gammaproteobacteria bacterium]
MWPIFGLSKDTAGTEPYTKEVLQKLPHLKVISRLGVGMDNIDL